MDLFSQVLGELNKVLGDSDEMDSPAVGGGAAKSVRVPGPSADAAERIQWCRDTLARLQVEGYIRSDRNIRDSVEKMEHGIRHSLRRMSIEGDTSAKSLAEHLAATYTDDADVTHGISSSTAEADEDAEHHGGAMPTVVFEDADSAREDAPAQRRNVSAADMRVAEATVGAIAAAMASTDRTGTLGRDNTGKSPLLRRMNTQEINLVKSFGPESAAVQAPASLANTAQSALEVSSENPFAGRDGMFGYASARESPEQTIKERSLRIINRNKTKSLSRQRKHLTSDPQDARTQTLNSFTMSKVIRGLTPTMGCQILLEGINEWDLDIFRLHDLAQRRPLTVLAMHVLHERGLVQALRLRTETLAKFFLFIENAYQDVPYHNNQHATDVLHSVHCLLRAPAIADAFSQLEVFCALVAAAVHDANHPGRTNGFLIKTVSPLALLYNDASVLENHHLATAFRIMQEPGCNILESLDEDECLLARKLIVAMVMSTDMAKHTKFFCEFAAHLKRTHELVADPASSIASVRDQLAGSADDRVLVLCNIVHSADLGAATKPWHLCLEWTNRLMMEFCEEGDEELKLGLEVTPLYNRRILMVPSSQVGFITYIALPLWQAWADYVSPGGESLQMNNIKSNLEQWQKLAAEQAPMAASRPKEDPAVQGRRRKTLWTCDSASGVSPYPSGSSLPAMQPGSADSTGSAAGAGNSSTVTVAVSPTESERSSPLAKSPPAVLLEPTSATIRHAPAAGSTRTLDRKASLAASSIEV